jgi:hypothetical protein
MTNDTATANRYDERGAMLLFLNDAGFIVGNSLILDVDEHFSDAELADFCRREGLLTLCLGCGTSVKVDPFSATEAQRHATARAIDWEAEDCHPDADRVIF